MESRGDNDSEQSLSTAEATLRHIEYVVMTLDHMNEQLSDFRGMKASLARLERSLRTTPSDADHGTKAQDTGRLGKPSDGHGSRSLDAGIHRRSDGSMTSAARNGEVIQTPKLSSELLSSIYGLEAARAEELRSRRRGARGSPRKPAGEADMLGLFQRSSHDSPSSRKPSRSASLSAIKPDRAAADIIPEAPPSIQPRAPTSPPAVCRRKSLDDLRQFHDAVIASPALPTQSSRRNSLETATAVPRLGWFLLSMIGILDFFDGRKWRCLARCSLLIQTVGVISLVAAMSTWTGDFEDLEPLITTALYFFGVAAGVFSLRRNKITCLLGPSEYMMDDYALESDFLDD